MSPGAELEPVIGLEVHVQLATRSKLFCACACEFGAPPNAHTCPICAGHPGVLPVPNAEALRLGVRAALALGCELQLTSKFDRKHYFYPDLPKGYQISQFDQPFARGGRVVLEDGREVEIARIHWEEDAGKSLHERGRSLVDLNRCGVPLIEIVGEPALESPPDAHAYLDSLKRTLRYAQVSECDMEKGSLRCDANVSLRPRGAKTLGTKVEIKNLNSFKMVERALAYEIARQGVLLARGEPVDRETRLWDDERGETRGMRGKEEAMDYRYFPEPDLPPIVLAAADVERERQTLPEPHWQRQARYLAAGLVLAEARVLLAERATADWFEALWGALGASMPGEAAAKLAANWTATDVLRLQAFALAPAALAELLVMVKRGDVSHAGARKAFERMVASGDSAPIAVDALGLRQISDPAALEPIVRGVLARSESVVEDWRRGKTKALDALKGMVMRETKGRANPEVVGALLQRLLGG